MTSPDVPYVQTLHGRTMPPSIERLISIAEDLHTDLCGQVVFIGGAVTPLLETDPTVLSSPRPTKDVDGVARTTSYTSLFELETSLRARHFRNADQPPTHIGRWISPSGAIFDLVGAGHHAGGAGSERDQYVIESAVTLNLPPEIRHVSGVGFWR